ncbi:MAG TPA: hypothetical protein DCG12_08070 [Planctomycetaceae bacterium]|nr:hypothetical protein [Planctomycetaceae bacterium]
MVTVRYRRIGANGQTKDKQCDPAEKAPSHADKLIASETGARHEEK